MNQLVRIWLCVWLVAVKVNEMSREGAELSMLQRVNKILVCLIYIYKKKNKKKNSI